MTLEDAANTGRSEGNMELAQQWIDDLKKTNAKLSKVWPSLLVICVMLSVLYLYSRYQLTELESQSSAEIQTLSTERDEWQSKATVLEEHNRKLIRDLNSLNEAAHNLEEQSNNVSVELTEKDRLIESLQVNVAELETNALETAKSLVLTKKELIELTQRKDKEIAKLNDKSSSMTKQLNDRKIAYTALVTRHKETKEEMDRLASLLDGKTTELDRVKRDRDSLRKNLVSTQKQLAKIKNSQKALEGKLSSLVSPISNQGTAKASDDIKKQATTDVDKGLAFQPITAPAPVAPEESLTKQDEPVKDASALEFDTIAID